MSLRHTFEKLAWRLAGFDPAGASHNKRRLWERPIPYRLTPSKGEHFVVFSPHLDDEVIGCGGLILLALSAGAKVDVIYVTDGKLGGDAENKIRKREAEEVSRLCYEKTGAKLGTHYLGVKQLRLDEGTLVPEFRSILRDTSPSYVFAPHSNDNHRGHVAVNRALKEALSKEPAMRSIKFLGYEIWDTLTPEAYVDISDFMDGKKELIATYQSQKHTPPYKDMIAALNLYRGGTLLGKSVYVEAFSLENRHTE